MTEQGFPIIRPAPSDFRYAVYCGSTLLDLRHEPETAVALFADVEIARRYGAQMWPTTYAVIDLERYGSGVEASNQRGQG